MSGTMELVQEAQKIIRIVSSVADSVCVNKNQCQRLAKRFEDISKALEQLEVSEKTEDDGNDTSLEESAIHQILLVLKKGETLVSGYKDPANALRNVLNRAVNHTAFKEIHEQIDDLKAHLFFPENGAKSDLNGDADTDRREMQHNLNLEGAGVDVRNVKMVVSDKCDNADSKAPDDLSYLHIPVAAITLRDSIKALPDTLNKGDAHLAGLALVHKGTWNGGDCAIKVFKSDQVLWNTKELRKEVASLVKLRHPHITQLIGCAQNENQIYVLYEKMDGDLRDLMKARKKKLWGTRPFSRTEEVSIITQIARGMFYLHEKDYVHGELKCTNLLVKQVGDDIDVKVADFHCSRELGKTPSAKLYKPTHRARWLPPEAFGHYNVKQPADDLLKRGDVYSFAMTCVEVVTGGYPFDGVRGDDAIKQKILAGDRPKLPDDLSVPLKNIILKCWAADPQQRPCFEDICHLLRFDSLNLISNVQRLFSCFGTNESPVADNFPEDTTWPKLLNFDERKLNSNQENIDGMTKALPHHLKLRPSDLKPLRPLGKPGASAEVFAASWIGCKFAVKWLKSDHVSKLRHEVSIMITLLHPHVVRLVGFSVMGDRCAIVMELMEKSLRDLMTSRMQTVKVPFSESETMQIITKIALGMRFLHCRGVAHGDLKCANVLVRNVQTKGRKIPLDVKLVDFGLSQFRASAESSSEKLPPPLVGWWQAPECKKRVPYDPLPADVYSFAMTCYEVITGKEPFYEHSQSQFNTIATIHSGGGTPKMPQHVNVHEELKSLLNQCWSLDPQLRPTFPSICKGLAKMPV